MTSLPKILVEFVKIFAVPILIVAAFLAVVISVDGCLKKPDPVPSNYELRLDPDGGFEVVVPK